MKHVSLDSPFACPSCSKLSHTGVEKPSWPGASHDVLVCDVCSVQCYALKGTAKSSLPPRPALGPACQTCGAPLTGPLSCECE